MQTGTVKGFDEIKGYGFVQPDDGGRDVFVHVPAVQAAGLRELAEGQKGSFDVAHDRRSGKPAAINRQVGRAHGPARSFTARQELERNVGKFPGDVIPRSSLRVERGSARAHLGAVVSDTVRPLGDDDP